MKHPLGPHRPHLFNHARIGHFLASIDWSRCRCYWSACDEHWGEFAPLPPPGAPSGARPPNILVRRGPRRPDRACDRGPASAGSRARSPIVSMGAPPHQHQLRLRRPPSYTFYTLRPPARRSTKIADQDRGVRPACGERRCGAAIRVGDAARPPSPAPLLAGAASRPPRLPPPPGVRGPRRPAHEPAAMLPQCMSMACPPPLALGPCSVVWAVFGRRACGGRRCPLLPWSRASSIRRPVEAHIRRGWRCSVGGGGPGCPPPCCALALPPCLSFLPVRAPAPFGRRVLVRVPVLFGPAPVFPPGGARAGALPCPSFCWSCPCPVTGAPLRLIMLGGFVLFLRAGVPWRALAAWCFGTPPAGCTFTLSSIGTGFRPCVP